MKNIATSHKPDIRKDGVYISFPGKTPAGNKFSYDYLQKGKYHFMTHKMETIYFTAGIVYIKIEGQNKKQYINPGHGDKKGIRIPAKTNFTIEVKKLTTFTCLYGW